MRTLRGGKNIATSAGCSLLRAQLMLDLLPIIPFASVAQAHARVPGSKSITNRALALMALCDGPARMDAALFSRDTRIMLGALKALGVQVEQDEKAGTIALEGVGGVFPQQKAQLDVGNAGTAARFLTALLAAQPNGDFEVDGDEAMHERPMQGLTDALQQAGADFKFLKNPGHIPFRLRSRGFQTPRISVDASASSQMLSALLIAAAGANTPLEIELQGSTVSWPFVEMTLRMIEQFGVQVTRDTAGVFRFEGNQQPRLSHAYRVEPDATAASYFLALPAITGGSIEVGNISHFMLQGDINFTTVLEAMGMRVEATSGGLRTTASGTLKGVTRDFTAISDTFLTLAAISPLLEGETLISGIAHTRKQETDRVAGMAAELRKLGQQVEEGEDFLRVTPNRSALMERAQAAAEAGGGIEIETYEDHRFAMSFGILGCHDLLGNQRPWITIRDPGCCGKTFPNFFEELERVRAESAGAASPAT